ncbi:transcription termination factor 3, mitochondrial [Paramuricea clavata]|nr:transcription termination factor 3, mitochondrial [Paramuricea clavata]
MEKNVNFLSGYTTQFRDPNVLISHLIPQYPKLLFRPIDVMEKRIRLLEKCINLNKEEIAKVLRYNPMTILTRLEDTFDDLVKYLKDCGLSDKTIHTFFTKQPRSITYCWEAIEKRVRFFMDKLGYTRERIIEVFTNNPKVFTANVERMRKQSDFIKKDMGLTNQSLIRSPLVLLYSLEQLQWRYYYLCQIGYKITDDTHLLDTFYQADELFAKYIAKRPVDEILAFKDDFYENLNPVSDDSNIVGNTVQC